MAHLVPVVAQTDIVATADVANTDLMLRPAEQVPDAALERVAARLRAAISTD